MVKKQPKASEKPELSAEAVVIDELSGVFERVEPESYRALQEVVGGCPVLADLAGPGTDSNGYCVWRRLL